MSFRQGARQFFERRGAPAWTNPYVTDGLVAMWDGEWNAGPGVHDENSTALKDLVGNNDLTINSSYATWSNNALILNSANTASADQFGAIGNSCDNVYTIEICSENIPSSIRYGGVFFTTGYKARGVGGFGGGWIMSGVDKSFTEVQNGRCNFFNAWYSGMNSLSLVYHSDNDNDDVDLFLDGIIFSGTTTLYPSPAYGSFTNTAMRFNTLFPVHNVRIYSRDITASEIAANYAIDKARFNLP